MVHFFGLCFFIGFSASMALGPIFMLTFNRSATYGFLNGFATALGSAIVDGIFFMLALAGALSLIATSRTVIMVMDFIGGFTLIIMGIRTLRNPLSVIANVAVNHNETLSTSIIRSFMITLFNPAVMLFFMVVSIKFFDDIVLTSYQIMTGGFLVALGSLTMLTLVALFSWKLGASISARKLLLASYVSGLLFIATGAYFIFDFVKKAFF